MKQFFEQYGAVALGILALLVLIAMITPVGNIIKTSLQSTVHTTAAGIESQTDTMTESMNSALINATDFTGAKDGKYYSHGQIVADTTLPDGTNRGTEGWRLTDNQYQALIDDFDLITNNNYAIFYHKKEIEIDPDWSWNNRIYIFNIADQSDYYTLTEGGSIWRISENPIQFFSKESVIPISSKINTTVKGYSGYYSGPATHHDTATIPVTSLCETLNLGCEVGE